jgi:hypothetical protein
MTRLTKTKFSNKTAKKSKTQKNKKSQKGGINYLIGKVTKDKSGTYIQSKNVEDNFAELQNTIQDNQPLPNLHITNLETVSVFPNKDNKFIYHSLFIAQIDKNISGELNTINWSIIKFFNDLLDKLNSNSENNPNKVKYGLKDIKINDFKFEIKNEINTITISGNVYISNINKLNSQIEKNVYDKLPTDTTNIIQDYIGQK